LSQERERRGVVDVDVTIAEVAYEEVASEDAKACGGDSDAPGRVEVATSDSAGNEVAVEIEYINNAVTGPNGLDVAGGCGVISGGGDGIGESRWWVW